MSFPKVLKALKRPPENVSMEIDDTQFMDYILMSCKFYFITSWVKPPNLTVQ